MTHNNDMRRRELQPFGLVVSSTNPNPLTMRIKPVTFDYSIRYLESVIFGDVSLTYLAIVIEPLNLGLWGFKLRYKLQEGEI